VVKARWSSGGKPGLTLRKVMLCVWWDWKRIVRYELLSPSQTIDSNLYCQQLERLRRAIKRNDQNWSIKKTPSFITMTDLTYLWRSIFAKKLRELGWEVLMHLPYSPDLALSDYLFWFLQNFLNDVKLISKETCENHLQFFAQKSQKF